MDGTRDRRRTDTRARVRRTALELFATQGYEATGLAQVADRLGITRPAVYHHFGSKSELLVGSYDELGEALGEIVAAAGSARESPEARQEVLGRLDELCGGDVGLLLSCAYVNENALRGMPQALALLDDVDRLASRLGGESVSGRMRGRLALGAVVQAHARAAEVGGTLAERRRAAREIAEDLLAGPRSPSAGS